MDEDKLNIIRPFGPAIAKVKMPEKIINALNDHVDKIVNNEELSKKFDNGKNLAGNVKQELSLNKEISQESGWSSFLANSTRAWIKFCMGKNITEFHIKRIYPPGGKGIIKLTPDEMLQYLEFKVQQHIPACSSKDYLLKRVTATTEHNSNFKRLNNYVELLPKRSKRSH